MTLKAHHKLAFVPERVIPDFIYENHPEYVELVVAYFDYLDRIDTSVSPVDLGEYAKIQHLLDLRDIDETLDDFLDKYRFTHTSLLPKNMEADFRFIVKMIKSFYTTKGTEESFKIFFEMVFNADVEFVYPKDNILRASDGKWTDPRYILPDPDTIGAAIPGSPTLAEETAFVDRYVQGQYPLVGLESNASGVGEQYVNILAEPNARVISLSNVSGAFQPGEYFYPLGLLDPLDDPNYNPLKQTQLETLTEIRDVKLSVRDGYAVDTPAWISANNEYLTAQSNLDEFEATLWYMSRVNLAEVPSSQTATSLTRSGRRVSLNVPVSGYDNGDIIQVSGAINPNYNGQFSIYNTDADNFYFQLENDESEHSVTIVQAAGTATVTDTTHGFKTGDTLIFSGADQSDYNIEAIITVLTADTYTYNVNVGAVSPATGTITARLTAETDAGSPIEVIQIRTGGSWQDGWLDQEDGYWSNDDGKVSHVMVLQDSDFWQDFSYLLKSEIHISNFLEPILTNLHPAGFKLFSELIAGDGVLIEGSQPKLVPEIIINGERFGLIEWLIDWVVELFGLDALIPVLDSQIMEITGNVARVTTWGDRHKTRRFFEQTKEDPDFNMGSTIGDLDDLPIDYFDYAEGHFLGFLEGTKIHIDDYDIEKNILILNIAPGAKFSGLMFDDGLALPPDIYTFNSPIQKTVRAWDSQNSVGSSMIFADGLELKSQGISHFPSNVSGDPDANGSYLNITSGVSAGQKVEIIRVPHLKGFYTGNVAGGHSVIFEPSFALNKEYVAIFANGVYIPPKYWKVEGNMLVGLYGTTFAAGKVTAYNFSHKLITFCQDNLSATETMTNITLPHQESTVNLIANEIVIVGP